MSDIKENAITETSPRLKWDLGTAYDFFISLYILHKPEKHGLRPSWAAGVRSRLSPEERETLETAQLIEGLPTSWIYGLPQPKDASTALWSLRQIPPAERLPALTEIQPGKELTEEYARILLDVYELRSWDEQTLENLKAAYRSYGREGFTPSDLAKILDAWSQPADFGERWLAALHSYYDSFFAEEEQHIQPALEKAIERAKSLAERLSFTDLIEELSQGVRMEGKPDFPEIVLVPSYWVSPFVILTELSDEQGLIAFGARPEDVSLVPGELVPDSLLRALKAIADPTRLRILHYLAQEPMAPSQLARRLRLRAPTVTHHLHALRLAGLVQVLLKDEERRYATRMEALEHTYESLNDFIQSEED